MMDLPSRRERINLLISDLAKSTAPEGEWLRELLQLQFEDAKDRLIDAQDADIPRTQGEARFLEKIHRQMTAAAALLRQNRER